MDHAPERAGRAPARELLLANHSFPGEYVIKAFGPGHGEFRAAARAAVVAVVGEDAVEVRERGTTSGARCCVTFTLQAQSVADVEAVYERLHDLDDLLLIL
jgi:putative lipoic acid-binding regulatory protein